jgi:hypothetical protein
LGYFLKPEASEVLLQMLYLLVDGCSEPPSEELVNFCKEQSAHTGNVRFLLPVLKSLRGREILAQVPAFMGILLLFLLLFFVF